MPLDTEIQKKQGLLNFLRKKIDDMNALRNFLENYTSIPESDWQIISNAFTRNEFTKNEVILEEGKICRYFYFLEKGMVRFYNLIDGEDISKFFTVAPYCFTSRDSFRPQKPALENIQALEKCIAWQITHEQSNQLLELKSWNTFTRNFVNEVQSHIERLLMDIKAKNSEERYLSIKNNYPELIDKIPLKYLSGFLGIAPQSLSRIRKKLSKDEEQ